MGFPEHQPSGGVCCGRVASTTVQNVVVLPVSSHGFLESLGLVSGGITMESTQYQSAQQRLSSFSPDFTDITDRMSYKVVVGGGQ